MNDVTISGVTEDSATDPVERVSRAVGANRERPRRDHGTKVRRLPDQNAESSKEESADEATLDHELDSLA